MLKSHRWTILLTVALVCAWSSPAQYRDRDSSPAPATSAHAPAPEARIDLNHATVDELMKVPGMKQTWARRIVRYRPYRTKQDLLERGIVPEEVYERIEDFVIAHRANQ